MDFGIEKVGIYPGRFALSISDLAEARGLSYENLARDLLVEERAVFPPWEDAVTMAVNAADPILTDADRSAIGLLIAATETSIDQEKCLSSWIHGALDLPDDCRNFEIKHACAGMMDGVHMARAWLGTPAGQGRKALVVNADQSLLAIGKPWEPVNGGAGGAVLVSDTAHVLRFEGGSALHTTHITDVIRPTPWLETGNGQESLYGYLEALVGSFSRFLKMHPEARDFDEHFKAHLYHTPFAGMAYRAHRTVLQLLHGQISHAEARDLFDRRVLPALPYNRRIGASYGASTFIALTGLLHRTTIVEPGDRISLFAYGAGSSGEFHAAIVGDDPHPHVYGDLLEHRLDSRIRVSVDAYEGFEQAVNARIGLQNYTPESDRSGGEEVGRLYRLVGIEDYVRHYEWMAS